MSVTGFSETGFSETGFSEMKSRGALLVAVALCGWGCAAAPEGQAPAGALETSAPGSASQTQEQVSQVVARVNGKPLYKAFYEQNLSYIRNRLPAGGETGSMDEYLNAKFDALERLIDDELIFQEAQRQGLMAGEPDVLKEYARMTEAAGGEAPFLSTMYAQHITKDGALEAVRRKLTVDNFIKVKIDPQIQVSDSDIAAFYNANLSRFTPHRWSRVAHVLVTCPRSAADDIATRAARRAAEIAASARAGTPFAKLATEFSEDPSSAVRGGSLGWMKQGEFPAEFEAAVESLSIGQISDPVRTDHGYHIIQLLETKGGEPLPLEEVKDACREGVLKSRKAEMLRSISSQLKSSAEIVSYMN